MTTAQQTDTIIEVNDLRTYFFNRNSTVKAVDGVSFSLRQGETLGIVGESGCGKTMTALSLLRLIPRPAARIVSGEIWLNGQDLLTLSDDEMRQVRGRQISMILQDPQTSLNPVFTIGNQLVEALAERVRAREPERCVAVAHMELAPPSIADGLAACAASGASEVIVHPYFLGPGNHTARDIPRLVAEASAAHPELRVRISEPLGLHEKLVDVVLERIDATE